MLLANLTGHRHTMRGAGANETRRRIILRTSPVRGSEKFA
ncbi:MAG: hypothetical protein AVDCRST_MAG01-01-4769 [uncultured Rubrobacteraceae bacterium]|uniref:Uncharacterized protein n=1 Tax=uncultured Rubrobacteraceae bacterium TaxID=349277 RepID=A0A6J4QUP9_9ACTN|nr:MAG: hypothetical protein AVDCRST_MAG01-01-4769 [uncultured Rubrobacteraceae bacterium]